MSRTTSDRAKIESPRLPKALTSAELPLTDDAQFTQSLFAHAVLSAQSARNVGIEQCHFKGVNLSHTRLRHVRFKDVRLERCDLS
ncbi:MAG: pentapeptide repeat-containing protein, partial [Chloroflexi bacterium]|nr:pentapeptide repeat-containing protein [Chloroflexota bacterium]